MQTSDDPGADVGWQGGGGALDIGGASLLLGHLDRAEQTAILADVDAIAAVAPFVHPETRWGKRMSVGITAAGALGWVSDRRGYRYEPRHPAGMVWPPIPPSILTVWRRITGLSREPDCCLVNRYAPGARMGLHQDRDEASFDWPVLSISLGSDALFRIGGTKRGGPTQSVWLRSGDVLILGGAARLAYHGIDRLRPGTSTLLPDGGRINLTLRVVT